MTPSTIAPLAALLLCPLAAQTTLPWTFNPPQDLASNYVGKTPVLDVGAMLNEDYAGQSGYITSVGHRFFRGDGQPIRFWSVTVDDFGDEMNAANARFLAKRGVNMMRWHWDLHTNNSAQLDDVDQTRLDEILRLVEAYKQEGMYSYITPYFILRIRMQARWGIDGYDQAFLDSNADARDDAPFGLQFFDEKFTDAIYHWYTVLMTTPNPHDAQERPLKDDPAVAILELNCEDNVFFWTFNPEKYWPLIQQQRAADKFGAWLARKYGSTEATITAWNGNKQPVSPVDDFAAGRVGLARAEHMANDKFKTGRLADQIRFLTELQYNWYRDFRNYLEKDVGVKTLMVGSNWDTANNQILHEAEFHTYTAAGIVAYNNYFDATSVQRATYTVMSGGDTYYHVPAVKNPRRLPSNLKMVEDFPAVISETAWTFPIDRHGEAAPLLATYGALHDLDGWMWFDASVPLWECSSNMWQIQTPAVAGQFPASALIYRRGDVAEAPAVVREGRTLEAIATKTKTILPQGRNWDPTRDKEGIFNYDPATGAGFIDPLAHLAGKVEFHMADDRDYVDPELDTLNDKTNQVVRSATKQLTSDHKNGVHLIDAPRAQGAVGFLNYAGTNIDLSQVRLRMRNEFGSIIVIALDDQPLNQSSKILVQAFTEEKHTGWSTEPYEYRDAKGNLLFTGVRLNGIGGFPYLIDPIEATVSLKWNPKVLKAEQLDANGYLEKDVTASGVSSGGLYRLTLPKQALYTVLTIEPPADRSPVVTSPALQNAIQGQHYSAQLTAIGGDGALTWSAPGALPAGLGLGTNGLLSGQPATSGIQRFNVTVTDADGDAQTAEVRLGIIPSGDFANLPNQQWSLVPTWGWVYNPAAVGQTSDWLRHAQLGWLYVKNAPWIYHAKFGWLYAFPGNLDTGRWFYSATEGFLFTSSGVGGWFYSHSQATWIPGV